jgi:hypothetical protein
MYRKLLGAFLSVFVLSLIGVSSSFAFNLSISPGKKILELPRDGVKLYQVKIINNQSESVRYKLSVSDYVLSDSSSGAFLDAEELADSSQSVSNWITVPETVLVEGNSRESVDVQVVVPQDATFGDHFGAVFFEIDSDVEDGAVAIQGKIASLMILKVVGGEPLPKDGSIRDFTIDSRAKARNPVTFNLDFINESTSFFSIETIFEIYEIRNQEEPINVLSSVHNVFPNVIRGVKMNLGDLGDDFGEGEYLVRLIVKENLSKEQKKTAVKAKIFYKEERRFEYFVPLSRIIQEEEALHNAGIEQVDKAPADSIDVLDMVKELILYIGVFLIVLLVLIRVLFFPSDRKKKGRKKRK